MKAYLKVPTSLIAAMAVANAGSVLPAGGTESCGRARRVADSWRADRTEAASAIARALADAGTVKGGPRDVSDVIEVSANGLSAFVCAEGLAEVRNDLTLALSAQAERLEGVRSGARNGDIFAEDFKLRAFAILALALNGAHAVTQGGA